MIFLHIFLGDTQSDNEANMILIIFLLEMLEFYQRPFPSTNMLFI